MTKLILNRDNLNLTEVGVDGWTYLIFVADTADIVRGEFSCHVEKI